MTDPAPIDENAGFRQSSYELYVDWKGWRPFSYGADEADSFRGELGRDDLSGLCLLEIGFGAGNFLAWAMDRGAQIVGAEANPQSRDIAAARGVELLPADLGAAVEANRDRFDYILAFDVFEHMTLPQIVAGLNHCAAMLKPDGALLLRFPNAQSPFGQAPQYADVTHVTPLSGEQLVQLSLGTPLEVVAARGAHRPRGRGLARRAVRLVRYLLQDLVGLFVRFTFLSSAPIAPVMTVILKRRPSPTAGNAVRNQA